MTTKSALFTTYNHLRGHEDAGRLNRALGIAQSHGGHQARGYQTTATSCTCPDWRYRISRTGGQCKHQIALTLETAAAGAQTTTPRGIDMLR